MNLPKSIIFLPQSQGGYAKILLRNVAAGMCIAAASTCGVVHATSMKATNDEPLLQSRQSFEAAKQSYRYKGYLDVRVIEPQGAQYILGVKFQSGYSKPVHYTLRHYNGKAALQTFKPFYEQNNGDDLRLINITHKYYFSMRIREKNDKDFSARVKLFKRSEDVKIDINKPYRFNPEDFRQIEEQPIQGQFNEDNEYLFVDSGELKLYVKLNFDLIFTRQEIIDRFNQSNN